MSTSAVPGVVGWLVDTFTAANTLGAASPPVSVRCGPRIGGDFPSLVLWVGADMSSLDVVTPTGAVSQQTVSGMGANLRDEDLSVFCCAEAWSGATDTRGQLTAVYGIVAAAETIVRANPTLGGFAMLADPGTTAYTLQWFQGEGGLAARVLFQVGAKAAVDAP